MAIERRFIEESIRRMEIYSFLKRELEKVGYAGMDMQRTPLGVRITVYAERPGMVIGTRGKNIQQLTDDLKERFELENPQIEVKEIEVPELNPHIMAHQLAASIKRGIHFRRAAYWTLRRIMEAGAQGVEIVVSGKLTGARSRTEKFVDGYIKHAGEPAKKFVREGFAAAQTKPGTIGVKMRIMPPEVKLPDRIRIESEEMEIEETKEEETGEKTESEEE